MTSAIDRDDYNYENKKYQPEISLPPAIPQVEAQWMEHYMKNHPLDTRAVLISSPQLDPNTSTYIVDTAIRVKIPSDQFRQEKVAHWEQEKSTAQTRSWVSIAAAVVCAGGAYALQANPLAMGTLVVCCVASVILAAYNANHISTASHQIEGWKASPLEKIAKDRVEAYKQGFAYVYEKKLKIEGVSDSQILYPQEVAFLFDKYFYLFYTKLLNKQPSTEQQKAEWLHHFTDCNPVSSGALLYALERVPDQYLRVSSDYELLHKQLTDIRSAFSKLRDERREETHKVIKDINTNRDLAIAPFALTLAYWKNQAEKERDQKLNVAGITETEREKVKAEYKAAVNKYTLYYTAAIIPVNLYFDNQVSTAKENLKKIIEEIRKNEAASHAPFFNYAYGLLNYAKQVREQPQYVYAPQPFNAGQVFHIPTPSAPPVVNINFVQQAQQQRPQGIDDSNYADYLKFIAWQQHANQGQG